jgi:hypothetical protein
MPSYARAFRYVIEKYELVPYKTSLTEGNNDIGCMVHCCCMMLNELQQLQDRFISKMFLRGDSVIMVLKNPV